MSSAVTRWTWAQVCLALAEGRDPGPVPEVFQPDAIEALATRDPRAAMAAVRAAAGWAKAPHDLTDLAFCLRQWRCEPPNGHFVKAEQMSCTDLAGVRVAVAACGDCGFAVFRRGPAEAAWTPIWPVRRSAP